MTRPYRLLAAAAAFTVLTGLLGGEASAAGATGARQPDRAAPPAVQIKPDGTVVFTAIKRGADTAAPNAIIICSVYPQVPVVNPPDVVSDSFVDCNQPVSRIWMKVTLVHYGNWWRSQTWQNFGEPGIFGFARKVCLPDQYRTMVETEVQFPPGFIPPSARRTDNTRAVHITTCGA